MNAYRQSHTIRRSIASGLLLLGLCCVVACNGPNGGALDLSEEGFEPRLQVDENAVLLEHPGNFETDLGYDPEAAVYYDLVNEVMQLNDQERAYLEKNGFVIADRHQWDRFVEGYAWIYKNDLPVVVTTDSILHAVHQSYSDILMALETGYLQPQLEVFLTVTRNETVRQQADAPRNLKTHYQDVLDYLTVARILVRGSAVDRYTGELDLSKIDFYNARTRQLVEQAILAQDIEMIDFLGDRREIDFTTFQPRGHYNETVQLSNYFRAMTWLSHIDYRILRFDPLTSEPILSQDALVSALILQDVIGNAEQEDDLDEIDETLKFLVGPADNTTLSDLSRLAQDMDWRGPADVLQTADDEIITRLLQHDYGQQRITGQLLTRHAENQSEAPVPRPVSLLLLGQRFSVDTWAMGNVVYDRLLHQGIPVERPYPTGFDVMAALGNPHTSSHLEAEFEQYPYESTLATIQQQTGQLDESYWQSSLYNLWLNMIRQLNRPTTAEKYPLPMRTEAWADKTLHTQLASWAQLRHDNLLYVKQSYTMSQVACEFPAIYVEPYPEFYAALFDLSQAGLELTRSGIDASLGDRLALYFQNMGEIAVQLTTISEKQLAGVPLDEDEHAFLASIVKKKDDATGGCAGPSFEDLWDGWYMHLIIDQDETPAVIADVHTNPNNDPASSMSPPGVLHVAAGPTAALLMIVETEDGPTLFVGPALTYYEFVEEGDPLNRLNDDDWRGRLTSFDAYPIAPDWVDSFRIAARNVQFSYEMPRP